MGKGDIMPNLNNMTTTDLLAHGHDLVQDLRSFSLSDLEDPWCLMDLAMLKEELKEVKEELPQRVYTCPYCKREVPATSTYQMLCLDCAFEEGMV
jgi:hypothetical protein